MNATIQTKKGRPNYYVVLRFCDENGKRRQKWIQTDVPLKGNNKRRAEEIRREILAEHEGQNVDLSRDVLFIVFMEQWLENLKNSIAPTTYKGYSVILQKQISPYFKPMKLKVRDITPAHIQQYINFKMNTLSPNTVIKHLRNISKCLDSAVRQNLIAFNPVKRVEMPKMIRFTGAKRYNEKQIEQLLDCSKGDPLEIVILLTIFYGLRRSEVLGIKWDAVDFENNTLAIRHTVTSANGELFKTNATKNDSSYAVLPMPDMIKNALIDWRSEQLRFKAIQPNDYIEEGYICTRIDGNLIKPDYVTDHFQVLLRQNCMPIIRFHDLRHSSANFLKYLGFDLKDIQVWLRHGDIQTTMNIYVDLDMDEKRNIADVLNERFMRFAT